MLLTAAGMASKWWGAVFVIAGACGCGGSGAEVDGGPPVDAAPTVLTPGCEVLDPGECLLPWPSSVFLGDDGLVALPADEMPANGSGVRVDPEPWDGWDGYSAMTSMIARVEGTITHDGLGGWRDPSASLEPGSATVVLDVDSGERIAHFVDVLPEVDDPSHTTIVIRPAARMPEGHHVVVAIRGLAHPDGTPVRPTVTFQALRDGAPTEWPQLEARRAAFETDVLAPLVTAGIDRASLILAWDFRTASGEHASRDLTEMVRQALAQFEARPADFSCAIAEDPEFESDDGIVESTVESDPLREIFGTFQVPSFYDDETARLRRDDAGAPIAAGTRTAKFYAVVPRSGAGAAPGTVPLLLYGHGLGTQRVDVHEQYVQQLLSDGRMIGIATDVTGLDRASFAATAGALGELSEFSSVADQVLQALVATVLLPRVFATHCAALPRAGIAGLVSERPIVHYYGNSQGGIVGITIAALSPDIARSVHGVGGISYPTMIPRSTDFSLIASVLSAAYHRAIDRDLLMVMFANHWDRFEGATFAPMLAASETDRVLFQVGVDDVGTPTVAAEIAARTLGLPVLGSSASTPWGIEPAAADPRSAYVAYAFAGVTPPDDEYAPVDNCVHESVRRDPDAQEQILAFLVGGSIADTCDGTCADHVCRRP